MAKEPPNLHRIEELAARKAQDTIYQRLRALAEPVDVAGREGVMWGDIECLFAELRGERQGNVVHASIRSTKTAPLSPTMPRGDDALNDYISVTNQEIHNIISAKHIDVEIKFKMIKGIINRCPFGSVGARGAEGTRGVGSESLTKERPATTLTTTCPRCGEGLVTLQGDMLTHLDECQKCGWKA